MTADMKAITLTQPWATLVAIGAKRIETRGWGTKYRGPLAIHAAKEWTKEDVRLAMIAEPFKSILAQAGYKLYSQLPRGCVVATCELVSVKKMGNPIGDGWEWYGPNGTHFRYFLDDLETYFGNYALGRSAWLLHNVQRLPEPIPARGALGLWNWERP